MRIIWSGIEMPTSSTAVSDSELKKRAWMKLPPAIHAPQPMKPMTRARAMLASVIAWMEKRRPPTR